MATRWEAFLASLHMIPCSAIEMCGVCTKSEVQEGFLIIQLKPFEEHPLHCDRKRRGRARQQEHYLLGY